MTKPKLTPFDATDYLDSPEAIAAYLNEAFASDDAKFIAHAIDTVARAKGMSGVAKETKLSRESLYRSFNGKTKVEFNTVRKVLDAFDVQLVVKPKSKPNRAA